MVHAQTQTVFACLTKCRVKYEEAALGEITTENTSDRVSCYLFNHIKAFPIKMRLAMELEAP